MHPYLNNEELLEWCKTKGIHVTAYAPLGNVNPDFASALQDPCIADIAARVAKSPAQVCQASFDQSTRAPFGILVLAIRKFMLIAQIIYIYLASRTSLVQNLSSY